MFTKNNDSRYFIDNPEKGNCGSFALNVKEWYITDRDFDNTSIVCEMADSGVDWDWIFESLTFMNVKTILDDFKDEVRVVLDEHDLKKNEELIAYRIGINWDEEFEEYDTDFHFRVRRNGKWMEKCGSTEIRYCEFTEEEWHGSDIVYNGPIVLLAKKI